jgi:hypothetical protein
VVAGRWYAKVVALAVGFAGSINGGKSDLGLRNTPLSPYSDLFRLRRVTHEWSLMKPPLCDRHRQPQWEQAWHHICCLFVESAYWCGPRPVD